MNETTTTLRNGGPEEITQILRTQQARKIDLELAAARR